MGFFLNKTVALRPCHFLGRPKSNQKTDPLIISMPLSSGLESGELAALKQRHFYSSPFAKGHHEMTQRGKEVILIDP